MNRIRRNFSKVTGLNTLLRYETESIRALSVRLFRGETYERHKDEVKQSRWRIRKQNDFINRARFVKIKS